MRRIGVFCGSSTGSDPDLVTTAEALAGRLVEEGIGLVYGGGDVGLMGVLARSVLDRGGEVIGVIPTALFSREVGNPGVTELIEVDTMHDRKTLMYELADAFVALPGGLGTLEEFAEITTWAQLGLHSKPIALLDVNGFWQPLLDWFDRAVEFELLKPANRALVRHARGVDELLDVLGRPAPEPEEKWIDTADT